MRTPSFLLVYLAVCVPTLAAQQKHFLIEETTASRSKTAQFEQAQKDYCAAVVRGGAPECLVFSPTTFSPQSFYLTLLAFGSFGHYDQGTYTSKGLTPEQAKELSERRSPTVASNVESAIALVPEVSYTSIKPGSLALITDIEMTPGSFPALVSYMRRVELPAAHQNQLLSCELYQVVAGGDTNRFILVRRLDTFEQLDGITPFGNRVGSLKNLSGAFPTSPIRMVHTTVMRVRADLSAAPK